MRTFCGKGVYGAIAIGKISVLRRKAAKVTREHVENVTAERERFESTVAEAVRELEGLYEIALVEVGEAGAQIFEIHKMMLADEDFLESVTGMIERQRINAEYAVALSADNFAAMFSAMEDAYM